MHLAARAGAIEAAKREGAIAIVPCVENGFAIGADLARIAAFRARGAVYMTLTHNGHNALADSCNPRRDLGDRGNEHGGLSALGKAAIAAMNRAGMLVDVAHTSRDSMVQAADESRSPIVSTHSCISALCDHSRNMADWQLDVIRDVKGVIQITAVSAFLKANAKPEEVTVADFADHIDLRGEAHRHRSCGDLLGFRRRRRDQRLERCLRSARTSRSNWCGEATTAAPLKNSGAATSFV